MANKGFYIKSVVAKGELVQDSQINFVKGCNVVYGPSDTGKTSLYSVIEFLLGKSSNPKIPLGGYRLYRLFNGNSYLWRRILHDT